MTLETFAFKLVPLKKFLYKLFLTLQIFVKISLKKSFHKKARSNSYALQLSLLKVCPKQSSPLIAFFFQNSAFKSFSVKLSIKNFQMSQMKFSNPFGENLPVQIAFLLYKKNFPAYSFPFIFLSRKSFPF